MTTNYNEQVSPSRSCTNIVVEPRYYNATRAVATGSLGVGTCDSSTCQLPRKKRSENNAPFAAFLILASAFSASIQSFLAKLLGNSLGIHWSVTSLSINLLSLPVLIISAQCTPPKKQWILPQAYSRSWLWLRALLGGFALNAAILAVTNIPLASANTIMFSMPVWASIISAILDKEAPARAQQLRLILGFLGTIIVCYTDSANKDTISSSKRNAFLGYAGALSFAFFNAACCVITSRKLRTASPSAVCASQALVALCISTIAVTIYAPQAKTSLQILLHNRFTLVLLLLEVIFFPLSMLLRTAALLTTTNAHIVGLLYAEIPLVLLWNRLFLHNRSTLPQLFGVSLIILGVLIANIHDTNIRPRSLVLFFRRGGNEQEISPSTTTNLLPSSPGTAG